MVRIVTMSAPVKIMKKIDNLGGRVDLMEKISGLLSYGWNLPAGTRSLGTCSEEDLRYIYTLM